MGGKGVAEEVGVSEEVGGEGGGGNKGKKQEVNREPLVQVTAVHHPLNWKMIIRVKFVGCVGAGIGLLVMHVTFGIIRSVLVYLEKT